MDNAVSPSQSKTVETEAYVVGVRKNTVNVLVPRFGMEGPLSFAVDDSVKFALVYDASVPSLTIRGPSAEEVS